MLQGRRCKTIADGDQLVDRRFAHGLHRRQDTAAFGGDLRIRHAAQASGKLVGPRAGMHHMRMRVHKARHHRLTGAVHHLQLCAINVECSQGSVNRMATPHPLDPLFIEQHGGIAYLAYVAHSGAGLCRSAIGVNSHQRSDIRKQRHDWSL